jgi:hypothetical protein
LPPRLAFDSIGRLDYPFNIVFVMDQRSIVFYLHFKAMSAQAIYDDLVVTLGPKALAYSTATIPPKALHTPMQVHLTSTIPVELFW